MITFTQAFYGMDEGTIYEIIKTNEIINEAIHTDSNKEIVTRKK